MPRVYCGVWLSASVLLATGCQLGAETVSDDGDLAVRSAGLTAEERGRDIWFENTYGGEKFFSLALPYNPDETKRIRVGFQAVVDTPRDQRFDVWGVINDPDCEANPAGGMDLCDDPEASGVVGIRFKGPSLAGDGTNAFGVACAACHAGFDPLNPPADVNEPSWDNIHATIGNQYAKFGDVFGANLAPTDVRALMLGAWPRGTADTTLLFSDNIMNPGVVTAFWEHKTRNRFDVGLDDPQLRNGQGGEDDVGDLAAVRVYSNIGMCFFECSAPAMATGTPIDIDTCRDTCADFPPQQDLDDMFAFLATFDAPQYPGRGRGLVYSYGRYTFDRNCEGCHDRDGTKRHVLSTDEVIPLATDPANNTNACRSLTSNWETGKLWAEFSSDVYKDRVAAGDRGYRVMPLGGIWATTPFMHNQSIGDWAPANASPYVRSAYYWDAMWELLQAERAPVINTLPIAVGPFPAGTPLGYVFSRDPATGALLCDDVVENRGHHYGSNLGVLSKIALIYWLQYQ